MRFYQIASNGYDTGGSLGWKTRGSLHGDFEKVAYELEPSTTGNPKYAEVKTSHGYVCVPSLKARNQVLLANEIKHIIMIEGRK